MRLGAGGRRLAEGESSPGWRPGSAMRCSAALAGIFFIIGCAPMGLRKDLSLREYVNLRDDSYSWDVLESKQGEGFQRYLLSLVSQTWRSEAEVDRTLWTHRLEVVGEFEIVVEGELAPGGVGHVTRVADRGLDEPAGAARRVDAQLAVVEHVLHRGHHLLLRHLAAHVARQLEDHPWPGNVRELRNVVERAVYRWDSWNDPIGHVQFDPFDSPWKPFEPATRRTGREGQGAPPQPAATTPGPDLDSVDDLRAEVDALRGKGEGA